MQQYQNVIQDKFGNVIVGASVAVYVYGTTTPATIYSGNGTGVLPSNTVTTNSLGEFAFYAANGRYSLSVSATNFVAENFTDFIMYDPADIGAVAASGVAFTPFGTIAATNVQNAIQEVVSDLSGSTGSSLVGFLQSGTGAQATTVQAKLRETVSPEDFGAVGDGVTDDTNALRAWLNASANKHFLGGPDKIYIVNAPSTGDVILPLATNSQVSIFGNGATIKVKNSSNQFSVLIGSNTSGVDLSNLTIDGVIFDGNSANNTYPVTGSVLTYGHYTIAARKGTNIKISNCILKNVVSTNCLFLNGNDGTGVEKVTNVYVENNKFINIGGSASVQDHSTMYLHCSDFIVNGNYGEGASLGATGTACFIETHGTRQSVINNVAKNYVGFANISGIYDSGDTEQSFVSNNVGIALLEHGVRLFSIQYSPHTTGYGIIGLTVCNNRMRIKQTQLTAGTSKFYIGYGFQSGATLPVKDVQIANNVVEYDLESTTPSYTAFSYAVGSNETTGTIVFENFVIKGNTIVNAPGPAVGLGNGGGTFKNCHIGENTLINPGQSLSASVPAGYKAGVSLDGYAYSGSLTIDKQTILDTHAVTRMNFGVVSYVSTDCSTVPMTVDLDIKLTGDKVAYVSAMDNYISYLLPLMTARQNKAHTKRFNNFKVRSSVLDTDADVEYKILTTGYVWTKHSYGTAAPSSGTYDQGSTVINTSPAAGGYIGWVCTTTGTPGTWKQFAAILP